MKTQIDRRPTYIMLFQETPQIDTQKRGWSLEAIVYSRTIADDPFSDNH